MAMVVVVCATHGCNSHAEGILTFRLELKHVFAFFKVVHVDSGSCITTFGVGDGLFWTDLVVLGVVVFGFIVAVGFVVVVGFVVFREGKVVTSIVSVEFFCLTRVVRKNMDIRGSRSTH